MSEDRNQRADRLRTLVAEGARLLSAGKAREAVTHLEKAWAMDPRSVPAAINLGGAYILLGKHDRAIPVLEAASRLEPENVMIWTNLAASYLGKLPFSTDARQTKAIQAYERALSIDPTTPHADYNLALIYLERQDRPHAAIHFRRALVVNPADHDARRYLDRIEQMKDTGPGADQVGE
jgi:tetratricopeptide (TPR) repeat protein